MSILKEILNIRYYQQYIKPYIQRIKQDGGVWNNETNTQLFYKMCRDYNIVDSIKFAWLGEAGHKQRTSGINTFWTKLYSLVGTNDATQTTSTSQPYVTGNIAPTEKIGMKNPNGGFNYMTHPTISFAANEAWSVTTVLNWNGLTSGIQDICGKTGASSIRLLTNGIISFVNTSGSSFDFSYALIPSIGKSVIVSIISNSSGSISLYINGVFISSRSATSTFDIASFFVGRGSYLFGSISAHIIRAQALTPSQVAAEANFLRSLYPEIPSVTIGSQTWATSNCEMVATPQGNLIQNITANSNVEKITNAADREFSSDTGFWTKGTGWAISGGVASRVNTGSASTILASGQVVSGKFYKITFTITNILSGGIANDGAPSPISRTTAGTYTEYYISRFSNVQFYASSSFEGSIDNISVQEVGWSDATNLYNYVYTNTAGTDEQKTYAAVKAAAMWCYYNNDASLGAIYGKLYNDYAMKLLAMDIAYYNTANPTTPWGWDVPLEADYETLQTTVSNNAEALKKDGTVYWISPNAGTNSTLFTALPAGYRDIDGTFRGINTTCLFLGVDHQNDKRFGSSVRLIKR